MRFGRSPNRHWWDGTYVWNDRSWSELAKALHDAKRFCASIDEPSMARELLIAAQNAEDLSSYEKRHRAAS